jgi:hypothetical protein
LIIFAQRIASALAALEIAELFRLDLPQKIVLLKQLCLSCYDTSAIRHLLSQNADDRSSASAALLNTQKDNKRKAQKESAAFKEAAIEECRRINKEQQKAVNSVQLEGGGSSSDCAVSVTSKKKTSGGKDVFDPSPSQVNSMVDDMRLRRSLGIDVVLEEYPDDLDADIDYSKVKERGSSSRAMQAEMERRRKEIDQATLMRQDAVLCLEHALESNKEKDIRNSIKYAKQAGLEGNLRCGKKFCTAILFKVL